MKRLVVYIFTMFALAAVFSAFFATRAANASTVVLEFIGTIGTGGTNLPPEVIVGNTFNYKMFIDPTSATVHTSPTLGVSGRMTYEFVSGTSRVFGSTDNFTFGVLDLDPGFLATLVFRGDKPGSENFTVPNLSRDSSLPDPILDEVQQSGRTNGGSYTPPNGADSVLAATKIFADLWKSAVPNDFDFYVTYTGFQFDPTSPTGLNSRPMVSAFPLLVDNVKVSTIPLPFAMPMFVAGLGALGVVTRRKRRKAVLAG